MQLTNRNYRGFRGLARKGFTLVEMLIVAALISIFAGLAIFSIQTQFEINKQKATLAECRQVATGMSFAYNDMSFFPKLCFLRFSYYPLLEEGFGGTGAAAISFAGRALEYHGRPVDNTFSRLNQIWKGTYLAFNDRQVVDMEITAGGSTRTIKWPADPWGNPYVSYLIHTVPPVAVGDVPTQRFLASAGEKADYFAGVVSYGRNRVPGIDQRALPANVNPRLPLRLYEDVAPKVYRALPDTAYNGANGQNLLSLILTTPAGFDPANPRVRDIGSDDLLVEF